MYEPDIDKLRRFTLAVGLVFLSYSLAGISLKPDSGISVIGLTFKVSRPEFLPTGLVIASLYSMIRYYYYAFMLKKSPYHLRRIAIDRLSNPRLRRRVTKIKRLSLYFYLGPIKDVESFIWEEDRKEVQNYVDDFTKLFPKLFRSRASARLVPRQSHDEDGEPSGIMYTATVSIPVWCRLAAIIQDIDYVLPILLNLTSLPIFFFWR